MRFIFLSLFLIITISIISFITVDTMTGNIVNTPNCPGAHTYAFYRTPEEKPDVEAMWKDAGFEPIAQEAAPDSFHNSGMLNFICLRRMTDKELNQYHMLKRESVVTKIG